MAKLRIDVEPALRQTKGAFLSINGQAVDWDNFQEDCFEMEMAEQKVTVKAGVNNMSSEKIVLLGNGGARLAIEKGKVNPVLKTVVIVFLALMVVMLVLKIFWDSSVNLATFVALLPIYLLMASQAMKPVIKQL